MEGREMQTIIVDEDDPVWERVPGWVQPTIPEMLAEGFREEAEFYLCDGEPYVVFTMSDYAQNWSTEPVQEVHPFYPCLHGTKMTEGEFRTLVKAKHGLT